jgi:hypothetical protein
MSEQDTITDDNEDVEATEAPPEEGAEGAEQAPARSGGSWAAPVVVWITVLLLALVTFAVLRIAGEQRYQSCVAAVTARNVSTDALSRFARVRGVQRCSHSPF